MEINIFRVNNSESKLRAYASVSIPVKIEGIEGNVAIKGIKVVEGPKGLFVAMPAQKNKKEEYKDIAYIYGKEPSAKFKELILEEYRKEPEPEI
jgi:stage V sporulation protein G